MTKRLNLTGNALFECESLAIQHNVWLLFYNQLQRYITEVSRNDAIEVFLQERKNTFLHQIAYSVKMQVVEEEVLSLLTKEGVPAVVLKGSALARDIYNEENSRSSVDIDVLVKRQDTEIVDTILTGTGFTRIDTAPLRFQMYRLHHTSYIHEQTKYVLEIHWNFSIPGFFRLSSEQIWDDIYINQTNFPKLSPAMTIIMLLMHHHIHAFKQLRNTIDLYWAMHVYNEQIDWNDFAQRLHEIGLVKTAIISINQVNELWKEESGKLACLQILGSKAHEIYSVPKRFLHYFTINLEVNNSGLNNKDRLFFRLALDRISTVGFSFINSMFPKPNIIKELYKDKRNWCLPCNYLKFMRWRLAEWKQ